METAKPRALNRRVLLEHAIQLPAAFELSRVRVLVDLSLRCPRIEKRNP